MKGDLHRLIILPYRLFSPNSNGAEWWHLRSELQKEISAPKSVRSFLKDLDLVTQEFLEHLPLNESFDILPKLARLSLERKSATFNWLNLKYTQ